MILNFLTENTENEWLTKLVAWIVTYIFPWIIPVLNSSVVHFIPE